MMGEGGEGGVYENGCTPREDDWMDIYLLMDVFFSKLGSEHINKTCITTYLSLPPFIQIINLILYRILFVLWSL